MAARGGEGQGVSFFFSGVSTGEFPMFQETLIKPTEQL